MTTRFSVFCFFLAEALVVQGLYCTPSRIHTLYFETVSLSVSKVNNLFSKIYWSVSIYILSPSCSRLVTRLYRASDIFPIDHVFNFFARSRSFLQFCHPKNSTRRWPYRSRIRSTSWTHLHPSLLHVPTQTALPRERELCGDRLCPFVWRWSRGRRRGRVGCRGEGGGFVDVVISGPMSPHLISHVGVMLILACYIHSRRVPRKCSRTGFLPALIFKDKWFRLTQPHPPLNRDRSLVNA